MVLHPDQATAGSNLMEVARQVYNKSCLVTMTPKHWVDEEMLRLVEFASAAQLRRITRSVGLHEGDDYEH
jgi:hypothetical protein